MDFLYCAGQVKSYIYIQRKQFAKFTPKIGHLGVEDVNGYADRHGMNSRI